MGPRRPPRHPDTFDGAESTLPSSGPVRHYHLTIFFHEPADVGTQKDDEHRLRVAEEVGTTKSQPRGCRPLYSSDPLDLDGHGCRGAFWGAGYPPDARAAVWRSRDGGARWADGRAGLPQSGAYFGVMRQALATDALDPAGVYFGTSNGSVYASRDEGETWECIARDLPAISSVETMTAA